MYDNHRDWMKEQLNGQKIYRWAVRTCGYKEIGIVVDKKGEEIGRYASHNNKDGSIDKIVNRFNDPDAAVKVEEAVLLEILGNMEYIKAHPVRSFFHYHGAFEFVISSYTKVALAVTSFGMLNGK